MKSILALRTSRSISVASSVSGRDSVQTTLPAARFVIHRAKPSTDRARSRTARNPTEIFLPIVHACIPHPLSARGPAHTLHIGGVRPGLHRGQNATRPRLGPEPRPLPAGEPPLDRANAGLADPRLELVRQRQRRLPFR